MLALIAGVAPELLGPPLNVLRLTLHPQGLAPRIANLGQWRAHLLERLRHDIEVSGDAELQALYDELAAYPAPPAPDALVADGVLVPLQLDTPLG